MTTSRSKRKQGRPKSYVKRAKIAHAYADAGMPRAEIARVMGVAYATVKGYFGKRFTDECDDEPLPHADQYHGDDLPELDPDDVPTLAGWLDSRGSESLLGSAQDHAPMPTRGAHDSGQFDRELTAAMRRNGIPLWSPREWSNGEATDRAGGGRPDAD